MKEKAALHFVDGKWNEKPANKATQVTLYCFKVDSG